MTTIGIDSHKASLAACAIDELGAPVAERTFPDDRRDTATSPPGPVRWRRLG